MKIKSLHKQDPWITALILAAGKSSRLKRPKQLLPFCGVSLIRFVAQVAIYSQVNTVAVILGAFQIRIRREVQHLDITTLKCLTWYRGMGATLKSGLSQVVEEFPQTEGFLLLLCDQPLISEDHIDALCAAFRRGKSKIIASRYSDTLGVPAIIHRDFLSELMELDDKSGAKQFLASHEQVVHAIDFVGGEIDVDTPLDLAKLETLARPGTSNVRVLGERNHSAVNTPAPLTSVQP